MMILFIIIEFFILLKHKLNSYQNIYFILTYILLVFLIKYRWFPMRFNKDLFFTGSFCPFVNFYKIHQQRGSFAVQFLTMLSFGIAFGFILPNIILKPDRLKRVITLGTTIIAVIEVCLFFMIMVLYKKVTLYESSAGLFYILGLFTGYWIYKPVQSLLFNKGDKQHVNHN